MPSQPLILDYIYQHEAQRPQQIYLTQPLGGGAVQDYSWSRCLDEARRMAAHLQSLQLPPGARIAILSKNCAHFILAELAIWMAGGTTVAIFPTESAETVRYVLEHSEASLLFVGKLDGFETQRAAIPAGLPCIALPLAPASAADYPRWDDIIKRTAPLSGQPQRAPGDLAMLIYTSGSTGQPKGVMHSFERITRSSEAAVAFLKTLIVAGTPQRVLSYLPLAHVYERAVVACNSLVEGGVQIYFAESLDTFLQDLQRARPTVFCSVPRLWLKFQQGVFSKMPAAKLDRLLRIPLLGGIVRKKVLRGLGLDSVQVAMSASAPIPPALIDWYRKLGLNLLEGYGMTEDFAYSHSCTRELRAPGRVGIALPGVQTRISEEGEILVKSPGQLLGYYKRPELNAEIFTADGFFHTGDKGEYDERGLLKLTGRVKELFKTSKGKYVAPAPLENLLHAHPFIELSLVSGVGQPEAYALIVLNETLRPRQQEAATRREVEQQLSTLLQSVNAQLPDYSRLRMLVILPEPWSIENGCLTPTMKVKRARIEGLVAGRLEAWYAQPGTVQWA
ncbi:AMP-binding acetyl-CoA synthetase [Paucibacter sp. KBW04]|uniref:AMP-binding protein n=1 Tax=Paucibacter sp. KBW04 TaxID=2153361 RepID=UPI000F57B457|nr:AMP-binding protein [Paucibacter sp. KBW04]RQO56031.1 AMP-binding acetyl-CoA synthetase [Paucibacter sp. KBW04]